jgi:hypothetical protein
MEMVLQNILNEIIMGQTWEIVISLNLFLGHWLWFQIQIQVKRQSVILSREEEIPIPTRFIITIRRSIWGSLRRL